VVGKIVISGMHSGTNPSPGLGIARSLRMAGITHQLIGLDYSRESSGLHAQVLDSRVVLPAWSEIEPEIWSRQLDVLLGPGDLYISSLDLEVRLIAQTFDGRPEFLSPSTRALKNVAKPPREAADALGLRLAPSLPYTGDDDALDDFVRASPAGVWVKGQHYEAVRAQSLHGALHAGRRIEALWGGPWHVERHQGGQEVGIAFAALNGELLGASMMRKSVLTDTGKTWAGTVTTPDGPLLSRLRAWVAENGWHGGGELELIEHWDGARTLMEINPRFPAWIHGATLVSVNLPASLVTGTLVGADRPSAGSFTRVVEEIPVHSDLGAPEFPWSSSEYVPAATKHPSGMPEIARRRLVTTEDPNPATLRRPTQDALPVITTPSVTPQLHLDTAALIARAQQFRAALDHADVGICYSIKTNPHPDLLSAALDAGMLAEAISQDEYQLAARLGAPPAAVVLNGPAKWWPHPVAPVSARAVFVDSGVEFALINELLDLDVQIDAEFLGVRLSRRRMGSRFGIQVDSRDEMEAAGHELRVLTERLGAGWGVHFHTAQSAIGVDRWVQDCVGSLRGAAVIADHLGAAPQLIDFGGGWHPRDLPALPEAVANVAHQLRNDLDLNVPWLFEPGKSLLEPCGTLLTRVIVPANQRGDVVVDAGLSDLPEGPYWPHPVAHVDADGHQRRLSPGDGRLLGRTCMERDVLALDLDLRDLRRGDLLAIGRAGGYDASMAYPFGRGRTAWSDPC